MNFRTFDLNLLRLLDVMMRERNTTRAAQQMNLSQPAVSSALARLRHMIGDPLFVRQGNIMVPTAKAEALAGPIANALAELELAITAAALFDPAQCSRSFRLFGSDFFSLMLMPELSAKIAERAPGTVLQLIDNSRGDMAQQLADRVVDIALEPDHEVPAWISKYRAFRSGLLVAARRNHPVLEASGVTPGSVIPLDIYCSLTHALCSPNASTNGIIDQALHRTGRSRRVALTLPQFQSVAMAVAAGATVAALPTRIAQLAKRVFDIETYRLPIAVPVVSLAMFWHQRHDQDAEHAWLRNEIGAILKKLDEPPEQAA